MYFPIKIDLCVIDSSLLFVYVGFVSYIQIVDLLKILLIIVL